MDSNRKKQYIGEKIVKRFLIKNGYHFGPKGNGYDILAIKKDGKMKIEIKTTQKPVGIPDCYGGEFDQKRKLVADFIYLVKLDKNYKLEKITTISKKEVDKYKHNIQPRIRLSHALKTDLKKGKIGKIVFPSNYHKL